MWITYPQIINIYTRVVKDNFYIKNKIIGALFLPENQPAGFFREEYVYI